MCLVGLEIHVKLLTDMLGLVGALPDCWRYPREVLTQKESPEEADRGILLAVVVVWMKPGIISACSVMKRGLLDHRFN
ncbi:unnamed protein product [Pieris macdunnoughi]|uniref:Uncharacterized protein n=1 Tax=Pieris macdunnoughi TaxID=345717 RepID=A0A821L3E5_9NEOP|nr:unnamed protein product [Pieris macdunnoughi]